MNKRWYWLAIPGFLVGGLFAYGQWTVRVARIEAEKATNRFAFLTSGLTVRDIKQSRGNLRACSQSFSVGVTGTVAGSDPKRLSARLTQTRKDWNRRHPEWIILRPDVKVSSPREDGTVRVTLLLDVSPRTLPEWIEWRGQ